MCSLQLRFIVTNYFRIENTTPQLKLTGNFESRDLNIGAVVKFVITKSSLYRQLHTLWLSAGMEVCALTNRRRVHEFSDSYMRTNSWFSQRLQSTVSACARCVYICMQCMRGRLAGTRFADAAAKKACCLDFVLQ